jgi:DNA-directed RNA polymerase specialized sigma subunit
MRSKRTKRDTKDLAMTQQEIGDVLGIERGMVSYLESRAMASFKKELERRGYTMEDFLDGIKDEQ